MKIAALSTLIVGFLLLSLNAEQAYAGSSSIILPLSGTVYVPLPDSSDTDAVALSGKFHIVVGTSASNSGDLLIHANLADVQGVGSSGSTYRAVGSTSIVEHDIGNSPPTFTFYFKLIKFPPSPCLDTSSCSSDNTASLFPLGVAFSVQETELGYWSATIDCVAYPPSPCLGSIGE